MTDKRSIEDVNDSAMEAYLAAQEPKVVQCCRDPQVRGGKCLNCDQWIEDLDALVNADTEPPSQADNQDDLPY